MHHAALQTRQQHTTKTFTGHEVVQHTGAAVPASAQEAHSMWESLHSSGYTTASGGSLPSRFGLKGLV
jgi:hypothetical protein